MISLKLIKLITEPPYLPTSFKAQFPPQKFCQESNAIELSGKWNRHSPLQKQQANQKKTSPDNPK